MTITESIAIDLLSRDEISKVVGGERVGQNNIRQEWATEGAYIVFFRRGTEGEHAIDDAPGNEPFRQYFDVEIYGTDIAEVDQLAETLKSGRAEFSGYNLYRGNFGQGKVQGVFVTDHNDDYQPRLSMSDEGLHAAFLDLQIAGYTEATE